MVKNVIFLIRLFINPNKNKKIIKSLDAIGESWYMKNISRCDYQSTLGSSDYSILQDQMMSLSKKGVKTHNREI